MPPLAMHMANELLSRSVALAFIGLTAVIILLAGTLARTRHGGPRVPLMGVLGAFVFAAQMINFPILPGTSGHLGGGALLAIVLGPHAATVVMASILIVQCLIFQDGGLLALGTNIFNLGVIPCYVGYTLFRAIAGRTPTAPRLYLAIFFATLLGMLAGAAMVPVQTLLSGVLAVPFGYFLLVMLALHVIIAFVEALITFVVVLYILRIRPDAIAIDLSHLRDARPRAGAGAMTASLLVAALLLGGIGSLFASESPDALEALTSTEATSRPMVQPSGDEMLQRADEVHERVAPMSDYQVPNLGPSVGTSISGIVGTLVTLVVVWLIGRTLRARTTTATPPAETPAE